MADYLYHRGENGCFEKAALYIHDQLPEVGDILIAKDWRKLDGSNFKEGGELVCGSCGAIVFNPAVEWFDQCN